MKEKIIAAAATAGSIFVAACIAEAVAVGGLGLEKDIDLVADYGKELLDPTPIAVKTRKGGFGPFKTYRTETVKRNPITGKISPYTGDKTPTNKKPIKIG